MPKSTRYTHIFYTPLEKSSPVHQKLIHVDIMYTGMQLGIIESKVHNYILNL